VATPAEADWILTLTSGSTVMPGPGSYFFPNPGGAGVGYGVFNYSGWPTTPQSLSPGGSAFWIMLHEFGHGIGLAHPHDNGPVGGGLSEIMQGVTSPGSYGTFGLNQTIYTVMSYNAGLNGSPGAVLSQGNQSTYGALDIALLQQRYGANTTTGAGDTVYQLPGANVTNVAYATIWDVGGVDTISYSGPLGVNIDLRAATLLNEIGGGGWISRAAGINGGFTIANGVVIENATGGSGGDTIIGNSAANRLTGNAGADTLDGGADVDTSVYSIASTSASWMRSPDGAWTVSAGADGTDTVTSVEFLDFTDRDVFLDRPQSNFSTDGVSDFFLRNSSTGAMVMWFNASGGNAASLGSLGTNWISEGIGDFNGDGRDDILWRDSNNGNMSMWFMNNNAVIGSGGFGVGLSWNISGVGDVNGDGRDDIIWRNNNGDLVLWFMNGTSISAAGLGNVSTAWQIEVVGDFNGDGRDDFIWRNGTTGDMSMWLMNGTAVTPNNFANVGGNWNIVGVGDLSGDGRDDVIWRDQTTGNTSLWFMNGGTIVSQSGFNVANNYSIADVGDYNGDGRDDIIWRNSATNDVLAWFMNGATVTGSTFVGGLGSDWIINPGG